MTGVKRTTIKAARHAQWQRWPHWVARAATLWAVLYAGFGPACALRGTPLLDHRGGAAAFWLGWTVVAVGAPAVSVSGAVVLYGPRPPLRPLLSAAHRVLAAVGAVLLAATAAPAARPPVPPYVRRPRHRGASGSPPGRERRPSCPTRR
ncbi:hypothetical protein ACGFXC_37450 [Streptomyces sp. NPDC048507]|uniref:hypothetical protein n=1 Tax=Streptomyces sp. NPDC048507 TaxID=3365560 RepID=UPI003721C5C9